MAFSKRAFGGLYDSVPLTSLSASGRAGASERGRNFAYDSPTLHPAVRKVCTQIREHLAEPWALNTAAQLARLSRSYFSELFHRETGLGYRKYVELCRLERATTLLIETRMQITEVADSVGYSDIGTLERAFKRNGRVTPRRFRSLFASTSLASDPSPTHRRQTTRCRLDQTPRSRRSAETGTFLGAHNSRQTNGAALWAVSCLKPRRD
jgi:AraC-like DNA-binding protein